MSGFAAAVAPAIFQTILGAGMSGFGSRAQERATRQRENELRATLQPSQQEMAMRSGQQFRADEDAAGRIDPNLQGFLDRTHAFGSEDLARRAAFDEAQLRRQLTQSGTAGAGAESILARQRYESGRDKDALMQERLARELQARTQARSRGMQSIDGLIDQMASERSQRRAMLSGLPMDDSGSQLAEAGGALVQSGFGDLIGEYRADMERGRRREAGTAFYDRIKDMDDSGTQKVMMEMILSGGFQ